MEDENQRADLGNRRTLEGQFVSAYKQMRLTLIFVGSGILAVAAISVLLLEKLRWDLTTLDLEQNIDPEIAYPIFQNLLHAQYFILLASGLIFLFGCWRAFRLSHRIWGPVIPLRRQVQALTKGDYKARVKLRPGDEFMDLMEDLNKLAEALEKNSRK